MLTQDAIALAAKRIAETAYTPVKVILFGSYARGDANEGSDLDFLVVEQTIPNPAEEFLKLHRAASGCGTGVDILLMTESEFEKKRNWWTTPVYAAAREGKVFYESAPHESVGFHAQQACEKFIKARLVLDGIVFERTHDLVALCTLASQNKIAIPVELETLRALNSYAVQFRYEGCVMELVPSAECEVVALCLSAWVNDAFDRA